MNQKTHKITWKLQKKSKWKKMKRNLPDYCQEKRKMRNGVHSAVYGMKKYSSKLNDASEEIVEEKTKE